MTLKFNAAIRFIRRKMHKIAIEMCKSVDITNEVFRKEAVNQEPVMVWPCKSNGNKNKKQKQKIRGRHRNLKMVKSFVASSRSRLFFEPGTGKHK
jgi:hypothetical protein